MNGTELRDICVAAAEEGAHVLRDLYDRPREVHFKGRIDLVTDADKASEEAVLRILRDRAPGARILAEESGASGDGAISLHRRSARRHHQLRARPAPLRCTVAAEENGVPVAGCTVDPLRDESFFAARGKGAVLRRGFRNRCASRPRARWWTPWSAPAFPTATATSSRRCSPPSASSPSSRAARAAWAAPRSISPTSRRAGWTASGKRACGPGTWPRGICSSRKPEAR